MSCRRSGGHLPANHPYGSFAAPKPGRQDPAELNYLCRYEEGNSRKSTWPEYYANKRIAENEQQEKEGALSSDIQHIMRVQWDEKGAGGGGPKQLKNSNKQMVNELKLAQNTTLKIRQESLRLFLAKERETIVNELKVMGLAIHIDES
jgi:hypothetical protein